MTSLVNNLCMSLIIICSVASLLPISTQDREAAIFVLLHSAIMYHLINQIFCCNSICMNLLHVLNFLLEDIVLSDLCFHLLLLELSIDLLIGNLLSSSPSLAPCLEQVGGRSLGSYGRRKHNRSF